MTDSKWFWPVVFFTLLLFVILAGVVGPQRAYERCLEKGGADVIGKDMICFDKEGKLVR